VEHACNCSVTARWQAMTCLKCVRLLFTVQEDVAVGVAEGVAVGEAEDRQGVITSAIDLQGHLSVVTWPGHIRRTRCCTSKFLQRAGSQIVLCYSM
jgi:hypothetical protein